MFEDKSYYQGERFIDFVVRSGYKDEPKVDEDGKPPSLCRTTPLHRASRSRFLYQDIAVRELFKVYDRFDLNYTDELGLSHFHIACESGCDEVVVKFLELGQDPNLIWPETGYSPLHIALTNKCYEVAESLLRHGAGPNLADEEGSTPLHLICIESDDDDDGDGMVEKFFKIIDDRHEPLLTNAQDKSGNTPLHLAMARKCTKMAQLLLKRGANPNMPDANGLTPLHFSCMRIDDDDDDLVKMLFKCSIDKHRPVRVDAVDNKLGQTPLHHALAHGKKPQIIRALLTGGADPNLADNDGFTALHIICKRYDDDAELAAVFFEACKEVNRMVQVDAQDNLGWTPLQRAVASFLLDTVNVLLDNGADLSNFVFPSAIQFTEKFAAERWLDASSNSKLILASGLLAVVERLHERGYGLTQNVALTIMTLFANCGLFAKSKYLEKSIYDKEEFAIEAKIVMIIPNLSLYDLIPLQSHEAKKRLTYVDYFKFSNSNELRSIPRSYFEACIVHLCEKLSSGFFRRWALDIFMEMLCNRMPIECLSSKVVE
ncbi:unnamed protein product [Trichogramma brassicae]|uniref:Uncharacterized protein n=1 Tax=Trichogramma brassicae TaxID=86971 RepID=A0A6H5J5K2_9HYME|nr:unnamed protein product [Trichogramma brassicae]